MPELGERLDERAMELLRERGVDIRLGTGLDELTADPATFSDGTRLLCRARVLEGRG